MELNAKGERVMERGRKEVNINMTKLLKIKPLVDAGILEIGDACKILDISRYLYRTWSKKINDGMVEMNK